MKKIITRCHIFMAIGTSMLTSTLYPVSVYLDNNYGVTLNYKTSSADSTGKNIGTNVRILLGDSNSLSELWVRTTSASYLSSSSYYDFKRFIDQIKREERQHANDDAIIAINAAYTTWDPKVIWEKKSKIAFEPVADAPKVQPATGKHLTQPAAEIEIDQLEKEQALMELTTADQRLAAIKNGSLGSDYARKATEICSANYANATQLGKINLCERLKKEIVAPVGLYKGGKTKIFSNLAPAIDEIKGSINRIHNSLAGYKSRGEAV